MRQIRFALSALSSIATARHSELLSREGTEALGIIWMGNHSDSHDALVELESYPDTFTWGDVDGVSYLTMSRNQHIPQYCGSCWAHAAVSALADRIKIARGAKGSEIALSVQHMLNCGNVGSCHGGTVGGPYQWLMRQSREGKGISYESSQPYLACSRESKEGICPHVDTSCNALNVARTCGSFSEEGGPCTGLGWYPNATIKDHGFILGRKSMMKEIYDRGPISCGIDAMPLLNYEQGIIEHRWSLMQDHVISVVGWGKENQQSYWIVRNSWGEFWGEMGYVRVAFGSLALERGCAWAVPGEFTAPERGNQVPCHEGGDNCKSSADVAV